MSKLNLYLFSIFLFTTSATASDGLINIQSAHDVKTTADRFENILKTKGMTIFTRIDHAEGAKKVGKTLPATELIIFGNPKVGTPLMQCQQSIAIDLPQKSLIWQDKNGQTWLSYNDINYLTKRHNLTGCNQVIKKIENVLNNLTKSATMP